MHAGSYHPDLPVDAVETSREIGAADTFQRWRKAEAAQALRQIP
jgi:hypothetical protein